MAGRRSGLADPWPNSGAIKLVADSGAAARWMDTKKAVNRLAVPPSSPTILAGYRVCLELVHRVCGAALGLLTQEVLFVVIAHV